MRIFKGYITQDLRDEYSYAAKGKAETQDEKYEVSKEHALHLGKGMNRLPIVNSHIDELVLGDVITNKVDGKDWMAIFTINDETMSGKFACQLIEKGLFKQLSLQHDADTMTPLHLSLVWEGAREGSFVDGELDLFNTKTTSYKDVPLPTHYHNNLQSTIQPQQTQNKNNKRYIVSASRSILTELKNLDLKEKNASQATKMSGFNMGETTFTPINGFPGNPQQPSSYGNTTEKLGQIQNNLHQAAANLSVEELQFIHDQIAQSRQRKQEGNGAQQQPTQPNETQNNQNQQMNVETENNNNTSNEAPQSDASNGIPGDKMDLTKQAVAKLAGTGIPTKDERTLTLSYLKEQAATIAKLNSDLAHLRKEREEFDTNGSVVVQSLMREILGSEFTNDDANDFTNSVTAVKPGFIKSVVAASAAVKRMKERQDDYQHSMHNEAEKNTRDDLVKSIFNYSMNPSNSNNIIAASQYRKNHNNNNNAGSKRTHQTRMDDIYANTANNNNNSNRSSGNAGWEEKLPTHTRHIMNTIADDQVPNKIFATDIFTSAQIDAVKNKKSATQLTHVLDAVSIRNLKPF